MDEAEVEIFFLVSGSWVQCDDVMADPPPVWEYGIEGVGPLDLLAGTGFLTFTLDNSQEK